MRNCSDKSSFFLDTHRQTMSTMRVQKLERVPIRHQLARQRCQHPATGSFWLVSAFHTFCCGTRSSAGKILSRNPPCLSFRSESSRVKNASRVVTTKAASVPSCHLNPVQYRLQYVSLRADQHWDCWAVNLSCASIDRARRGPSLAPSPLVLRTELTLSCHTDDNPRWAQLVAQLREGYGLERFAS